MNNPALFSLTAWLPLGLLRVLAQVVKSEKQAPDIAPLALPGTPANTTRFEDPRKIREGRGSEFDVTEFGAVADGRTHAGPLFRKAIVAAQAAGPGSVVRVPSGVWRLLPTVGEKTCLPITKARDLTVRGVPGKTELIIGGGRCSAFELRECEATTLCGFTVDYAPLPFTQGMIVAVDTNAAAIELRIDPGYPSLEEPMFAQTTAKYERWGMFIDAGTRWLKPGTPNFVLMDTFTPLAEGVWRLKVAPGEEDKLRHLVVGDLFVQLARGVGAAFTSSNPWLAPSRTKSSSAVQHPRFCPWPAMG